MSSPYSGRHPGECIAVYAGPTQQNHAAGYRGGAGHP